jgi:hypothetical protein
MRKFAILALFIAASLAPMQVNGQLAVESLHCEVSRKLIPERDYTAEELATLQSSVRLSRSGSEVVLQRCSFVPSANAVTCDSYTVDRVEHDPNIGVRKYYVFRGQFDVQVFADGFLVENNGRGGIAYGHCSFTD